ncbi:MAG: rod shape-determining protein MreC [bacterium]|nr:rod shape-determining protein MreC [bacterium]
MKRLTPLFILLVFLVLFSFRTLLSTVVAPLATPFVQAGSWLADGLLNWSNVNNLTIDEYNALQERIEDLSLSATDTQLLQDENDELRELLRFTERTQDSFLPASILSKSLNSTSGRLLLNIGSEDGVQVGSAVVAQSGMLLGKVIELSSDTATVLTISDEQSAVAVSLLNDRRTIGVATGTVGDLLKVEFIPVDEVVEENNLVVTSGLEEGVPSGLLVGIVNTIEEEAGVPFQTAILEPLVDVRRVSHVLVITDAFTLIHD